MPQIACYLPTDIERLIEPFVGGGSVFMNVEARDYLLNDLNESIIRIHQMLNSYCGREEEFFEKIFSLIRHYGLTFACNGMISGLDIKRNQEFQQRWLLPHAKGFQRWWHAGYDDALSPAYLRIQPYDPIQQERKIQSACWQSRRQRQCV